MARKESLVAESVRIEGGLFPGALLDEIRQGKAKKMEDSDYNIPKGLRLRDEIGRAFRMALPLWQDFMSMKHRQGIREMDIVDNWLFPLLSSILGYKDLTRVPAIKIGDRDFPVTHNSLGNTVPMVLVGPETELDKSEHRFGYDGLRRSATGLIQELLNAGDSYLYGIVSNGVLLRLYRDNHSLTRPAFVEIDLERMFTEELYADFALFYQLLHSSRLMPREGGVSSCIMEQWREAAHETGERAVENLRIGVTAALEMLANGFLAHPDNTVLRSSIENCTLSVSSFQLQLLRLVYRLIFLFTAEDRGLLLDPEGSTEAQELYTNGYSLSVLREKARNRVRLDDYSDCWEQLRIVFSALANGEPRLALPALGGLFEADQCPDLDNSSIANKALLAALRELSFFRQGKILARINYRDMDSEELGSVYESLLELVPQIEFNSRPWHFSYAINGGTDTKGNARKLSGSYYTPDCLVKELIRSALEPVITDTLVRNPDNPRDALLKLNIIDPACGSGHFLLAAARRVAVELARIDALPDQPTEKHYRHALREVISHCIYGVDLNPMAIELCRTALWLEALEPGKPLSFLDAHIRNGNALVGVLYPDTVDSGIPDEAYNALTGDDKAVASALKKSNKKFREQLQSKDEKVVEQDMFAEPEKEVIPVIDLSSMPEDTLADIEAKRKKYREFLNSAQRQQLRLKADVYTAAFFAPKTPEYRDQIPTSEDILRLRGKLMPRSGVADLARTIAERNRFFHWRIEFPDVFEKGGFDCVLGNPPWERIKLQEEEFFASRSPAIANAINKAAREKLINRLKDANKGTAEAALYSEFVFAKRSAEASSLFAHIGKDDGGRFHLTGVGDVNLYALFAELVSQIIGISGRSGVIVPSGIATDDSTKNFFADISLNGKLVSLIDFENREALFKGVHRSYKFCCLTLGKSAAAKFSFFLTNTNQLQDNRRQFTLTPEEVVLLNPNTRTCPVFRSQYDAELTKKIYRAAPVLIDENKGTGGNPWEIKFSAMFHMSNDSHLFKTHEELANKGGTLEGAVFYVAGEKFLPLYEAKMVHQYDHRWATYESNSKDVRDLTIEEKADPETVVLPRYWVAKSHVDEALKLKAWKHKWLMGFRDVTNATNERTVISGFIPISAVGHTMPCILPMVEISNTIMFTANLNTLVYDYIARQKIGGIHLTYGYFKQFPTLEPRRYSKIDREFITPRVLELTYTAHDLASFARDLGYDGPPFPFDPDRRAIIRAELDACYARLYGLTRDELRYILDPADLLGSDYPSETFRVLKEKEIREFGEYRTQRLVLDAWDRMERGEKMLSEIEKNPEKITSPNDL